MNPSSENSGMNVQKPKNRRLIRVFILSALIWPLGIGIFFLTKGCTEDAPAIVNLVLEENGKQYVYSNLSSEAVDISIQRNESPTTTHFLELYVDDKLYMPPHELKELVDLLSGNYVIHDYQEKSCDGYVTSGEEEVFKFEVKNEMTENIGEQIVKNKVLVQRPESRGSLEISWEMEASGEITPGKKCELVSFWVESHPSPGETVYNTEDILVTDLENLTNYFGNKVSLEFDEENKVLFVRRKK